MVEMEEHKCGSILKEEMPMKRERKSRNRVLRRLACLMAASILAAGFILAAPALSETAHAVELGEACSLTVAVEPKEMDGGAQEMPDVALDLYKVADAVPLEGQDAYTYGVIPEAGEIYAGLAFDEADSREGWQELAQQAAAVAFGAGSKPDVTVETVENDRLTTTGLDAGLYLMIARGRNLTAEEYIVRNTAAEEGETDSWITTVAYSDSYVFTYEPQLVSLPAKEADEEGNIVISGSGEWIYNATAVLKPELSGRYAALRIDKELLSYRTGNPATFVFLVEATLQGETVYSNVVSMDFNEAGSQSELITDKIPVGAEVTVTEVYSGVTYRIAEGSQTVQNIILNNIEPDEEGFSNIVSFRNEYDGTGRSGSSITNHFEYMDDGAGLVWNWTQLPARTE